MKWLLIFILPLVFLSGCASKVESYVDVSRVMEQIQQVAHFENAIVEDATTLAVAERYGISPDDITKGLVYHTRDPKNSDKVILLRAKNEDAIEHIEHALNAEIIGMKNTWKNDKVESIKVDEHILKTRDKYVILIVADNVKEIREVFDREIVI